MKKKLKPKTSQDAELKQIWPELFWPIFRLLLREDIYKLDKEGPDPIEFMGVILVRILAKKLLSFQLASRDAPRDFTAMDIFLPRLGRQTSVSPCSLLLIFAWSAQEIAQSKNKCLEKHRFAL